MHLIGYQPVDITPWETASGGKAIQCPATSHRCEAAFKFPRATGSYEVNVQYFDMPEGEAKFRLVIGDRVVERWTADDHLSARKLDGDSSTRRRVRVLTIHEGDEIRIEGTADGADPAALDYVEIRPSSEESASRRLPAGVQLTSEQGHQRTMKLLHIDSLRPGPSANPPPPAQTGRRSSILPGVTLRRTGEARTRCPLQSSPRAKDADDRQSRRLQRADRVALCLASLCRGLRLHQSGQRPESID